MSQKRTIDIQHFNPRTREELSTLLKSVKAKIREVASAPWRLDFHDYSPLNTGTTLIEICRCNQLGDGLDNVLKTIGHYTKQFGDSVYNEFSCDLLRTNRVLTKLMAEKEPVKVYF